MGKKEFNLEDFGIDSKRLAKKKSMILAKKHESNKIINESLRSNERTKQIAQETKSLKKKTIDDIILTEYAELEDIINSLSCVPNYKDDEAITSKIEHFSSMKKNLVQKNSSLFIKK